MTDSTDYEYAQILLELKIPRFGFPFTRGCKKRSAIAAAAITSSESALSSSPKATKITSATSLSFSPSTDHSDPDYNHIRKRRTTTKISIKREIKNVNDNSDLEKDSYLNLNETKQEQSVGESEDDIVSPVVNQVGELSQMNEGPTGIPDLNIPYEPVGSDIIEGLDVNAAMTNEESK